MSLPGLSSDLNYCNGRLHDLLPPPHEEPESIPGSPTPMLADHERQQSCSTTASTVQPMSRPNYLRRSYDQLPVTVTSRGKPSTSMSARSSPAGPPSRQLAPPTIQLYRDQQPATSSTLPARHARLALSHSDCEGPYRVKRAEQQQHQQLLQTFSSPNAVAASINNASSNTSSNSSQQHHPAWRRAKGLDTSWRSLHRDDDDNTTTSGSYTLSPEADLKDETYNADIMV